VLASRWWKDELTDYNPAGLTGNRKIGSVRYEFGVHGHAALAASSVIVDDKDVADAIARNVLVWDVRPADAYARGHIAGAINIGDAARVLRDDNTEDLIATDRIEKIMGAAGLDPSRETIVYGSRGAVNIPYEQNWVDPETQTKLARKEVSNNAGMSLKRTADLKQLYSRFDPKKETIVYCQSGARASETAGVLQELGFTNVKIYDSSWLGYGNTLDAPANNVTFFNVGLFNSRLSTLQERVSQLEKGAAGNSRCKRARGHETVAGSYRAGVREVPISGLLERSKTVCEGPSPEKPMHNAQGRPGKCCGGGGYLSTGNPPPKIDEAVFVGYRLNIGC